MVKQLWSGFKVALSKPGVIKSLREANGFLQDNLKTKCIAIVRLKEDIRVGNWKLFDLEEDYRALKDDLESAQVSDMVRYIEIQRQAKEIEALKQLLTNCRRLYAGAKYYNPKNHSDATVYVCAAFNDWYMIRQQNEIRPSILSKSEFETTYPGYIQMPRMNRNQKFIR